MKTILVPTDFSEKSDRAAAYGLGLAAALGTDLLLYNAFYIPHAEMTGTGMSPPFLVDYDLYERLSTSSLQKQAAAAIEDWGCIPRNRVDKGIIETQNSNRLLSQIVIRAGLLTVKTR